MYNLRTQLNKLSFKKINIFNSISKLGRYHEKVIDHYEKPRNVGSFDKNSQDVGTGLVGAPACGDVMKLQIKVNEQGVIENAVFKVNNNILIYRHLDVDQL
jgi:hypothetical protein